MNRVLLLFVAATCLVCLATPLQAAPDKVTCFDLCTGDVVEVPVDHPNTPGVVFIAEDFCLAHAQVKTCAKGENRSLFDHPVIWKGAIFKSNPFWWWSQ